MVAFIANTHSHSRHHAHTYTHVPMHAKPAFVYVQQTCRKSINERNKLAFDSEQAADMETVSLGLTPHTLTHILTYTHTHTNTHTQHTHTGIQPTASAALIGPSQRSIYLSTSASTGMPRHTHTYTDAISPAHVSIYSRPLSAQTAPSALYADTHTYERAHRARAYTLRERTRASARTRCSRCTQALCLMDWACRAAAATIRRVVASRYPLTSVEK